VQAVSDALDRELEEELLREEEQRGPAALAPRIAHEDKFDVVTKRIGDKLLAGWTMLERTCPVTGQCPLMREPGGVRLYSAQLDRFLTEHELSGSSSSNSSSSSISSSSQGTAPASAMARPTPPRAAKASPKASAQEEDLGQYLVGSWKEAAEHALEEDLEGLDAGPPRQHPFRDSSSKPAKFKERVMGVRGAASNSGADAASTRSVLSGVSVNGDTDLELERAEAAVRSKLKECRRALASLEVGNGADANVLTQIERLVAVLGTCGHALEKLRPHHL
jgi:uncharacterized Zn finger protein (UPF0148 family)